MNPNPIYLTGFSMGASAALLMALERPRLFAKVVAFDPVPPPKLPSRAQRAAITVVHGELDEENPFDRSRRWMDAYTYSGGRGTMIVVPGLAHAVPADMLQDIDWRRRLLGEAPAGGLAKGCVSGKQSPQRR